MSADPMLTRAWDGLHSPFRRHLRNRRDDHGRFDRDDRHRRVVVVVGIYSIVSLGGLALAPFIFPQAVIAAMRWVVERDAVTR